MFSVFTWQDTFLLKSTLVHKDATVFQFSLLVLKQFHLVDGEVTEIGELCLEISTQVNSYMYRNITLEIIDKIQDFKKVKLNDERFSKF